LRIGGGWDWSRFLVAIVETEQQLAHAALGVADVKGGFDPGNRFFGATNASIEPPNQLLLLCCGQIGFVTARLEGAERIDAGAYENVEPAGDRFRVDAQDTSNLFTVLTGIKQQDCLDAFADASLGGLFVAPLQIIALLAAEGKELLTHGRPPNQRMQVKHT
jgi:hypothetical protein